MVYCLNKRYVTQRSRWRFSMIYSASFESQLWLRKWKRKQSQKGKILFSVLKCIQCISFPDDKIARLCSTDYYTTKWMWMVHFDPHCSREKLFPQRLFCYCTIPLFLNTVQGHPCFGILKGWNLVLIASLTLRAYRSRSINFTPC